MALTSGFFTCSLGTVTVSTPFSIAAFTSSTLAFSVHTNIRSTLRKPFPLPSTNKTPANSRRDINGFDVWLLHLLLRHCNSEHPILHSSFHLIHFGVLWQPESPKELAAAPLNAVPLAFFSSCSLLLSPLICRTLPSSSSTFTSSFFRPGRSALNTWASGVSFQSIRALANADVSLRRLGLVSPLLLNGKSWNGSQMSREGIEDVGPLAEEAGNERHLESSSIDCRKENGTD
ncbi:hypothetical protein CKAN_02674800 [Cinnamomum micranthum f. kanehirae]|uniref:Uncharacterized protein n=1 Tax=Cinnamomum micranthum f. kanehirae TaxID=337451 RepID=A0A443Q2T6_9MAGN|nr:hypothetical protein CKAN_02674800 [Cinnamomum micranthum f. kanehirae]